MFGIFSKKGADPMLEYIRKQDETIARETSEYADAVMLDVEPSVPGNKVIFDDPSLESMIEPKGEGMTFIMKTGSIGLEGNRKIFKNDNGQVHRIEIFETSLPCRIYHE